MNYEPFTSIENPTLAHFRHFRHFSSLFTNLPSTSVENALQINLFMQNKPNLQDTQMNLKFCKQMAYENKRDWTLGENKPNSNPIKPNFKKAKMDVNSILTKDYRKKDDFAVRINKPNSNPNKPCPERSRMGQSRNSSRGAMLEIGWDNLLDVGVLI